jgi:hypothetical protein
MEAILGVVECDATLILQKRRVSMDFALQIQASVRSNLSSGWHPLV